MCLEEIWKGSGRGQEGVWKVSERGLDGGLEWFWKGYIRSLEGGLKVSIGVWKGSRRHIQPLHPCLQLVGMG